MSNNLKVRSSPFGKFIWAEYASSTVGSCSSGHESFMYLKIKDVFPTVPLPKTTIVKSYFF